MITVPSGPQSPSSLPASATGPQEAPEVVRCGQGLWSQRGRTEPTHVCQSLPLCSCLHPWVSEPTMGNGEARGGAGPGRVIPLLCLAGTQGERSQGLQGQPHVSHYGRYYGERVGLTVTFLCLALCPACRCVHTYSHARVCVSVCVCVCVSACTRGGIQLLSPGSWPATNVLLLRMPAGASLPSSSPLHARRPPSPPPG